MPSAIAVSAADGEAKKRRCGARPILITSSTVKGKGGACSWNTTPSSRARASGLIVATSVPPSQMAPERSRRLPDRHRNSVVFPEPFGPRRHRISPAATSKLRSRRMASGPYPKTACSTRTITAGSSAGPLTASRPRSAGAGPRRMGRRSAR